MERSTTVITTCYSGKYENTEMKGLLTAILKRTEAVIQEEVQRFGKYIDIKVTIDINDKPFEET